MRTEIAVAEQSLAEMTKPYALLLDKHLPNKVLNEVELIR
jgi:hypothetical protein